MNDKQQQYLDKVIEFIVRDTIIDHKLGNISFPFSLARLRLSFLPSLLRFPYFPTFEKYCIAIYGLTEEEIKYVWKQYKDIIKGKINER